jgi:hypothetical protein
MKINIVEPFCILQRPASLGCISQKVIKPAPCEALVENDVVVISHPGDSFRIAEDHFQELVGNGTIKIIEP